MASGNGSGAGAEVRGGQQFGHRGGAASGGTMLPQEADAPPDGPTLRRGRPPSMLVQRLLSSTGEQGLGAPPSENGFDVADDATKAPPPPVLLSAGSRRIPSRGATVNGWGKVKTAVTVSAALSAGTKPRQSMAWSAASSKHGGGLVRVMKRVLFANKLGRGVRSAMRNRRGSVSAFGSSVHGGKRGLSRSSTVTLTRGRIAPTLVRHVKFDLTGTGTPLLAPWVEKILSQYFGPRSLLRRGWPPLRLLLITYTWDVPYRLALRTGYDRLEIIANAAFVLGVAVQLMCALADDVAEAHDAAARRLFLTRRTYERALTDIKEKEKNGMVRPSAKAHLAARVAEYMSLWMWLDLAASVSLAVAHMIVLLSPGNSRHKWIYWIALVPHLVRYRQLQIYFRERELDLHVNVRTVAFYKFILLMYGTAHSIGCLFFFISHCYNFSLKPDNATWVALLSEYAGINYNVENASVGHSYVVILYKGFDVISAQNYEIVVPRTYPEVIFCIVGVFVQILLASYILGTINHYLVKKDERVEAFRRQLQALQTYCTQRSLPDGLVDRCVQYFQFQNMKRRDDDSVVLKSLTSSLRLKVASFQYSAVVERNSYLFGNCNGQFLNQLMVRLREVYLMPGEVIVQQRDMSRELLFVTHGVLELYKDHMVTRTLRAESDSPSVAGDVAFFMGIAQPFTIACAIKSDATCLILSKMDYEDLVRSYPEQQDVIMTNLLAMFNLEKDGTDTGGKKRLDDREDSDFLEIRQRIQAALVKRNADTLAAVTYAASEGDVDTVRALLKRGLPIDSGDYDFRTTLHLAAVEGNLKVVECLIQEGANVNVKDRWGQTPLQEAVRNKHGQVVEFLSKAGGRLDYEDPAAQLCSAASNDDLDLMKQMLDNGVDANLGDYDNRTALHLAASEGNMDVVVYLSSRHVDINIRDRWGGCPLEDAIREGHTLVAQFISSRGGVLNERKSTVQVCKAAAAGNVMLLKSLVENGASVNVTDCDGRSPLHFAAWEGHLLAVHYLLFCSADCDQADRRGATPLLGALENGYLECARLLEASGSSLGPAGETRKEELLRALAAAPSVGTVLNSVKGRLERVEVAMQQGIIPPHLVPAVVSDPRLCMRCAVRTLTLVDPLRENLTELMAAIQAEFVEDMVSARKVADGTLSGAQKVGVHIAGLQRIMAPQVARRRQAEMRFNIARAHNVEAAERAAVAAEDAHAHGRHGRHKSSQRSKGRMAGVDGEGTGKMHKDVTSSEQSAQFQRILFKVGSREMGLASVLWWVQQHLIEEAQQGCDQEVQLQSLFWNLGAGSMGHDSIAAIMEEMASFTPPELTDGAARGGSAPHGAGADVAFPEVSLTPVVLEDLLASRLVRQHLERFLADVGGFATEGANWWANPAVTAAEEAASTTDKRGARAYTLLAALAALDAAYALFFPSDDGELDRTRAEDIVNAVGDVGTSLLEELHEYLDDRMGMGDLNATVSRSRFIASFLRATGFVEDMLEEGINLEASYHPQLRRSLDVEEDVDDAWAALLDNMDEASTFLPTLADLTLYAPLEDLALGGGGRGGLSRASSRRGMAAMLALTLGVTDGGTRGGSGAGAAAGGAAGGDGAEVPAAAGAADAAAEGASRGLRAWALSWWNTNVRDVLVVEEAKGEWEHDVLAACNDVDASGRGIVNIATDFDRIMARINGGRTIPPADKQKVLQELKTRDTRVTSEALLEAIRAVVAHDAEFLKYLGGERQNRNLLMLPRNASPLIISPSSPRLALWNAWMRAVSLYLCFEVPFRISFQAVQHLGHPYLIVNELIDGQLLVDCCVRMLTAYVNRKSVLVYDFPHIAKHYLGTEFALDIAAALPLDILMWAGYATMRAGSTPPWSFMAWLRLTKMLRAWRLRQYVRAREDKASNSVTAVTLRLFALLFTTMHFCSCIMWYIGRSGRTSAHGSAWFNGYVGLHKQDIYAEGTVFDQYLLTSFWISTVLSTAGLVGNMNPTNMNEVVFVCILMAVNLTIWSYALGQISDAVETQDEELVATREKILMVETMISVRQLPPEISAEIRLHFDNMASIQAATGGGAEGENEDVFAMLSHSLQVDVAKNISRGLITRMAAFWGCDDQFLDSVAVQLREVTVSPESYLFRVNDVAQELFIISSGFIEICVDDVQDGEVVNSVKGPGECIGELSFFFGIRQTTHARTSNKSAAQLFVLARENYQELIKLFPEEEEKVSRNALSAFDSKAGSKMGGAASVAGASSVFTASTMRSSGTAGTGTTGTSYNSGVSSTTVDSSALDGIATVRRVLELAKKKKKNERIVSIVAAAADGNNAELRRMLGSSDVSVNEGDYDARTCLHLAASNGHVSTVAMLIQELSADVDVQDRYGNTPMVDAVRHKHDEVIRLLREAGSSLAMENVAALLDEAASKNDVLGLRRLIDNAIDPNSADYDKRTPLHLAASNGCVESVQFLLSCAGINPTPEDRYRGTPLQDAIRHGHKEVQAILRGAGAEIGRCDVELILNQAAAANDLETLQTYYDNGSDMNAGDNLGRTPLHVAASHGCTEAVSWLVSAEGIDINVVDMFGMTPLEEAVLHGQAVAQVILERAGAVRAGHASLAGRVEKQRARNAALREAQMAELVDVVVHCSFERKLHTIVSDMLARFEQMAGELRANLGMFLQTQRAISQLLIQESAGGAQEAKAGSRGLGAKLNEDDETTYPERVEQLLRLGKSIRAHLAAMRVLLSDDDVIGMLRRPLARMLQPGMAGALAGALAGVQKLEKLLEEYVEEGKLIDFDFERVRRDMNALFTSNTAAAAPPAAAAPVGLSGARQVSAGQMPFAAPVAQAGRLVSTIAVAGPGWQR